MVLSCQGCYLKFRSNTSNLPTTAVPIECYQHELFYQVCFADFNNITSPPFVLAVVFLSRIERLWRDVFGGALDLFYACFSNLEREHLLNPDEELHIYALHWSFLPHLQRHLQFFTDGWNNHRLRTEGNKSPLQLWTQNQREGQDPVQVCYLKTELDREMLNSNIVLSNKIFTHR